MIGALTNFDQLFDDFKRMEKELDQLLGGWQWPAGIRSVARGTFPAVNVGTTPEQVDVYLFAPGLDPQQIEVSVQQNLLTVLGERSVEQAGQGDYYRRERFSGSFRRVITLPEDVDPNRVDARYADGVLRITVQRQEVARPRRIEIK